MKRQNLDKILLHFPYKSGSAIRGLVPDSIIYKKAYIHYRRALIESERWSIGNRKEYILTKMTQLVEHAWKNITFYRNFYDSRDFHPNMLKSYNDIDLIPVVRKSDFKVAPLSERVDAQTPSFRCNTGGTSGQPLGFMLDAQRASGREWAHMEWIWGKIGYTRNAVRLRFRGKDLGDQKVEYSPFAMEIGINMYADPNAVASALMNHPCFPDIRFLHGYPGLIHETTRLWKSVCPEIIECLRQQVKGIFFGSEYPSPIQRQYLEEVYGVPSVSWYGHSEMAVLAYEKEEYYTYHPFITYGYAEPLSLDDGTHLISTAWDNFSHPFIRYDTEDLIEPNFDEGLMNSFKVSKGRNSEYILDRNGQKISLTGLIFGRHHEIFNFADCLQISQTVQGCATIHITSQNHEQEIHWGTLFNDQNVAIRFSFKVRNQPFRTPSGKTPLLIKDN